MPNAKWQFRSFQTIAALLLATAEAQAQERELERESPRRIVVSIPDRKLALVQDGQVLKIYPVAVGAAASPSPAGDYKVIERVTHPTWYGPHQVVPPGKSNPLGPRWIGLSRKGYGIHGTSNPRSIGHAASHGCIRMHNSDVEELFGLIAVGDPVELVAEPTPEVARLFGGTPDRRTRPRESRIGDFREGFQVYCMGKYSLGTSASTISAYGKDDLDVAFYSCRDRTYHVVQCRAPERDWLEAHPGEVRAFGPSALQQCRTALQYLLENSDGE